MRRLSVLFFVFCVTAVNAQPADTTALSPASFFKTLEPTRDGLVSIYYSNQPDSMSLYNGRQYYGYAFPTKGHAFYKSDSWSTGSLFYDGLWYQDVKLLYELNKDELIVQHPAGIYVSLFGERVRMFSMGQDIFVNMEKDKDGILQKGFYQVLAKGKATVYVKRVKTLEETLDHLQLERVFIPRDRFFIARDGRLYPVKNQGDLLNILGDKRQQMVRFRRTLGVKFKHDKEKVILRMVQHYNQL